MKSMIEAPDLTDLNKQSFPHSASIFVGSKLGPSS